MNDNSCPLVNIFKHDGHKGLEEKSCKTLCLFVPFVLKAFGLSELGE